MMLQKFVLCLNVFLLAQIADGLLSSTTHWKMTKLVKFHRLTKMMIEILKRPDGKKILDSVQTGWVRQDLDHFNPSDTRYFYQRYYISTEYWDSTYGPVFVYVGGEDELFPGYLAGGKLSLECYI